MAEWKKVTIEDVCTLEKGRAEIAKTTPGQYPLVTTGADRKTCDSYQFDTKAVCIPLVSSTGHGKKTLNYVHYQEGKFALGSILTAVIPKNVDELDAKFLHLYLSFFKDTLLVRLMRGAANVSLNQRDIKKVTIPLPPIKKQREIVAKSMSLFAHKEQLSAEIIAQQTLLKKLRQAILQEAVQGKLTAAWRSAHPDVEPAAKLLQRIQAEKAQLAEEQKIEQEKLLPPIKSEEIPFELPEKWVWCRIEEVCLRIVDCLHSTPKFKETGRLCVDTNCIRPGIIMHEKIRFVDEETFQERNRRMKPCKDDILFSREGALLGIAVKVPDNLDFCLGQRMMIFRLYNSIESDYFEYILNSLVIRSQYIDKITGSASPHLNIRDIRKLYIPFPSIEEQKIIVAKVNKLMTYCDELEQQITLSQTTAERLMQAVLREAFAASA